MSARRGGWTDPLGAPAALVATILGLPGCLGLALGLAPRDWPLPLSPQLAGDFALRTVVYVSGFLAAFGLIGLAAAAFDRSAGVADPLPAPGSAPLPALTEGHVSMAEPLYGFLPRADQLRLARLTGYQPLLYTKVSILLSAGVGVLLAGSWEIVPETEALPQDAVLRILAGLYLIAESARRYIAFGRGQPTGTLIGALASGAWGLVRPSARTRP